MQSERRSCRSKPDCQMESTQSQERVCPNVSGGWDAVAGICIPDAVWIWISLDLEAVTSPQLSEARRKQAGWQRVCPVAAAPIPTDVTVVGFSSHPGL